LTVEKAQHGPVAALPTAAEFRMIVFNQYVQVVWMRIASASSSMIDS